MTVIKRGAFDMYENDYEGVHNTNSTRAYNERKRVSKVTSYSNLENRLMYYAAGETVEITVQVIEGNEYVEKTVEITLGYASEHNYSGNQGGYGYRSFGRP